MAGNAPSSAALTNIVTSLANAIAGNQASLGCAARQTAPIAFATPRGISAVKDHIDYTTKHGASHYKQGMKALGTPFNMKVSQAVIFEKELQDRARTMGWDKGTYNILKFTNRDSRQINLIVEYGQIDANMLKTGCELFILATSINSDK